MSEREIVQPSDQPESADATGSGDAKGGATPEPVDPEESASTSGVGTTQSDQQAAGGPPPAESPYDVSGHGDPNPVEPRSDSGT